MPLRGIASIHGGHVDRAPCGPSERTALGVEAGGVDVPHYHQGHPPLMKYPLNLGSPNLEVFTVELLPLVLFLHGRRGGVDDRRTRGAVRRLLHRLLRGSGDDRRGCWGRNRGCYFDNRYGGYIVDMADQQRTSR